MFLNVGILAFSTTCLASLKSHSRFFLKVSRENPSLYLGERLVWGNGVSKDLLLWWWLLFLFASLIVLFVFQNQFLFG